MHLTKHLLRFLALGVPNARMRLFCQLEYGLLFDGVGSRGWRLDSGAYGERCRGSSLGLECWRGGECSVVIGTWRASLFLRDLVHLHSLRVRSCNP